MANDRMLIVQLQIVERPQEMSADFNQESVFLGVPEGLPQDVDELMKEGSPIWSPLWSVLKGIEPELAKERVTMVWVKFEDGRTALVS